MTVLSTPRSMHEQERLKDMILCLLECVFKETQFPTEMADELIKLLAVQNALGDRTQPKTQSDLKTYLITNQLLALESIVQEAHKVLQKASAEGIPGSGRMLHLISNYGQNYKGPKP